LRLRCRLENPLFIWLLVHFLLEIESFVWQDESLWKESEMLLTVNFLQLGNLLVHEVFASNVLRVGEVVDFLVST
jgi:hypothetical protein